MQVKLIDSMGTDAAIVDAARVSYNSGKVVSKDRDLIRYLLRNRHTTPFEMCVVKWYVKAPIFVFRQWHRHRTWCLSGDTKIRFARPCDGKPYWKTLKELADQWHLSENVKRPDKQKRSRRDYNRELLNNMQVFCIQNGDTVAKTHITDVILSGKKQLFEITVKGNSIKATKDHRFQTPDGWKRLEELRIGDEILGLGKKAPDVDNDYPTFSVEELENEEWKDIYDVSVSNLGRVKRLITPVYPTLNQSNRLVISCKIGKEWKTKQVSHLVGVCFLDGNGHVLHSNDNTLDNRVSNLYYGNDKDNSNDAASNDRVAMLAVCKHKILNIREAGIEETYDLSVEHSDHNFIAENLCTHNSYNEVSARYSVMPDEFYFPFALHEQSKDNKQGSGTELPDSKILLTQMQESCDASYKTYTQLIEAGVSREIARSVLPVNIYSEMYASCNLWNLMHFLRLRMHPHAQYEIRVLAESMYEQISELFPAAMEAFEDYILDSMSLSALEIDDLTDDMTGREKREWEAKKERLV